MHDAAYARAVTPDADEQLAVDQLRDLRVGTCIRSSYVARRDAPAMTGCVHILRCDDGPMMPERVARADDGFASSQAQRRASTDRCSRGRNATPRCRHERALGRMRRRRRAPSPLAPVRPLEDQGRRRHWSRSPSAP